MNSNDAIFACPIDTPAFSREYLNEDIPDFRRMICDGIPISVDRRGDGETTLRIGDQEIFQADALNRLLAQCHAAKLKFVCHNAVEVHRTAIRMACEHDDCRNAVWRLTDTYSLWDIGLFEQRLRWATEGRAAEFSDMPPHEALIGFFLNQFNRLVANLQILKNDAVGSMIFADPPPESPYIEPPERILARRFHYKERLHLFIHMIRGWKQYGPGGIGLDVQGAITADYLSRKQHRFTAQSRQLQNAKDEIRRRITGDDLEDFRNLFQLNTTSHEPDGSPRYKPTASARLVELWDRLSSVRHNESDANRREQNQARVRHERSYPLSRTARHVSLDPNHWDDSIPTTGPLRNWADYHAACKIAHHCGQESRTIPYVSMPYFKSDIIDFAKRQVGARPLFEAGTGRIFLQLRIQNFDILCYLHATASMYDSLYRYGGVLEAEGPLRALIAAKNERTGDMVFPPPEVPRNDEPLERNVAGRRVCICADNITSVGNATFIPAETWNNPSLFQSYEFFGATRRQRDYFLAAALRFLVPRRLSARERRPSWSRSKKTVPIRQTRDSLEQYVQENEASLPNWLRENELYLRLSEAIVHDHIRGYSIQATYQDLRHRFPQLNSHFDSEEQRDRWIKERIGFLAMKSSYHWKYVNEFLFTLLPKCGIDPYPVWEGDRDDPDYSPDLCQAALLVDGRIVYASTERDDTDDPLLQRAGWRATIRNTIRGDDEEDHQEIWNDYVLNFCSEPLLARNISTERGSEDAHDFFFRTNATSTTGKPGRPIFELEKPYLDWQDLADDIRRVVAYELIRQGAEVIAVAGDSFVVEAESDRQDLYGERFSIMVKSAVEAIMGVTCGHYGNFVETHFMPVWPRPSNDEVEYE